MVDVVPTSLGFASPFSSQSYQRNDLAFEQSGPDAGGGAPRVLMQDLPSKSDVKQSLDPLELPEPQERGLDRNRPTELSSAALESRDTALPSGPPSERGMISQTNTGSTPDPRDEGSAYNSVVGALRGAVYSENEEDEVEDTIEKTKQRIRERKQREREADKRHQEELARRREEIEANHEERIRRVDEDRRKHAMAKRREEELRRVQDQEAKRLRDERLRAQQEIATAEHRRVQARLKAQKQKEQRERAEKEERDAEEKKRLREEMERKAAEAQVLAKKRLIQQKKQAEEQKAEREAIEVIEKEYDHDKHQDKKADDLQRRAQARLQQKMQEQKRVEKARMKRQEEERQKREAEHAQEETELQARRELAAKRAAEKQRRARSEERQARAQKEEAERLNRERKNQYRNPQLIEQIKAREPSPMPITEERSRLDKMKRRAETEKLRRYGEGKSQEEAEAGESPPGRGRPPLPPQGARQRRSVAASPGNRRAASEDRTRVGGLENASERVQSLGPGDGRLSPARRAHRDEQPYSSEADDLDQPDSERQHDDDHLNEIDDHRQDNVDTEDRQEPVDQQNEKEIKDDEDVLDADLHDRSSPIRSSVDDDRSTPMRTDGIETESPPARSNDPVDDHLENNDLDDRSAPIRNENNDLDDRSAPIRNDDQDDDRSTARQKKEEDAKMFRRIIKAEDMMDNDEEEDDEEDEEQEEQVTEEGKAENVVNPFDEAEETFAEGTIEDVDFDEMNDEDRPPEEGSMEGAIAIAGVAAVVDGALAVQGSSFTGLQQIGFGDEDEYAKEEHRDDEDELPVMPPAPSMESEDQAQTDQSVDSGMQLGEKLQVDPQHISQEGDPTTDANIDALTFPDESKDAVNDPLENDDMDDRSAPIRSGNQAGDKVTPRNADEFEDEPPLPAPPEEMEPEAAVDKEKELDEEKPAPEEHVQDTMIEGEENADKLQSSVAAQEGIKEQSDEFRQNETSMDTEKQCVEQCDEGAEIFAEGNDEDVEGDDLDDDQMSPEEGGMEGAIAIGGTAAVVDVGLSIQGSSFTGMQQIGSGDEEENAKDDRIDEKPITPVEPLGPSIESDEQAQNDQSLLSGEDSEQKVEAESQHFSKEVDDENVEAPVPEQAESQHLSEEVDQGRNIDIADFQVEETCETQAIDEDEPPLPAPAEESEPESALNEEKELDEEKPAPEEHAQEDVDEDAVDPPTASSLKQVGVFDETPRWSIVQDNLEVHSDDSLELEPAHPPECLQALTSYNKIGKAKKAIRALGKPMEGAMRLRRERSEIDVDGEDRITLERRLLLQEEACETSLADFQAIIHSIGPDFLSDQSHGAVTQVVEGAATLFESEELFREYVMILKACTQALTADQKLLFVKIQELRPRSAEEQQASEGPETSLTAVVPETSEPETKTAVDDLVESEEPIEATQASPSVTDAVDDDTERQSTPTRPPYRRNQSPPHIVTGEPDEVARKQQPLQDAVELKALDNSEVVDEQQQQLQDTLEQNMDEESEAARLQALALAEGGLADGSLSDVEESTDLHPVPPADSQEPSIGNMEAAVEPTPTSEYPVSARDSHVVDLTESAYPVSARETGNSANVTPVATEPKEPPRLPTPMATTSAPHPLSKQSTPMNENRSSTPVPVPPSPSSRPSSRPPVSRPTSKSSRPLSRQQSDGISSQPIPLGADPLGALAAQRLQAEPPSKPPDHPSSADSIRKKRASSSQPNRSSQSADTTAVRSASLDPRRDSRKSTNPKVPLAPLASSSRISSGTPPPPPAPGWTSAGDDIMSSSMTDTMRRRADRVAADQQASAKDREDSLLKMLDKRQEQQRQKAIF